MDSSTYRGLAFLLSLGTLPIACKPDSDDTDGGAGSTTGSTGGATETVTGPTTTETGGGPEGCAALVDYKVRCDPSAAGKEAELLAECEAKRKSTAAVDGQVCAENYDAYHECLSAASCEETSPCSTEEAAALYCFPTAGASCVAFGAKREECEGYGADIFAGACQHDISLGSYQDGPACGAAIEEYRACLSKLACADFLTENGCATEKTAATDACPTGGALTVPSARPQVR